MSVIVPGLPLPTGGRTNASGPITVLNARVDRLSLSIDIVVPTRRTLTQRGDPAAQRLLPTSDPRRPLMRENDAFVRNASRSREHQLVR
jgi:hypothetical protein